MAIRLKSTKEVSVQGLKVLVYGMAGAGKTTLIKTLPSPVILSAEGGLLSLQRENIPYIEIKTMEDLAESYQWLRFSEEAKQFASVALDSLSEIAETVLSAEKQNTKDGRQAYGEMQDKMGFIIRSFRDMPEKNVYFSAKIEKTQNELGQLLYSPSMPGQKMGQALPYFFDEVLALRIVPDASEKTTGTRRMLMCQPDGLWTAKDRSGALAAWEEADLGQIIRKISGGDENGQSNGSDE